MAIKQKEAKSLEVFIRDKKVDLRKKLKRYKKAIDKRTEQKKLRQCIDPKDISGKGRRYFLIEDCEVFPQKNMRGKKAFVIERLRLVHIKRPLLYPWASKVGQIEYRISYYIVTQRKATGNKYWSFGQYCPLIPPEDIEMFTQKFSALKRRSRMKTSSLMPGQKFPIQKIVAKRRVPKVGPGAGATPL